MTKTRKKAREDAAQEAEMAEAGPSSQQQQSTTSTLQVSVPEDIDLDYLSEILPNIPDFSRVTPDAVAMLYKLVAGLNTDLDGLRREVDELNAEVERKDVELDQALQDKESLSKDLEENVESVHSELEQVKQERARLVEENNVLKSKVSQLSNSQTSSSSEAETLKHRLDDSEREKRDLLVVISRLKEESSQREEEIQTLRANLKEARHEHQTLESQVRELKSAETSTKFKIDTLTQQLQLAQAEAERSSAELTAKAEEYSKYRRTKHSEMLQLQSAYDSLTQEHATTKATLQTLQAAHSAQTNQLTQALSKIQALQGQIAEQESKYASEANGLKRLIDMMEEREKQAKEIVQNLEMEWATVGEKSERRENALKQEIERERQGREEAERRLDTLETVIQRMGRGDLPLPGTPFRTPGGVDRLEDGIMGLSPTVALASRSQKSGKTFTQVYEEYVKLQDDYNRKCMEHEQMERTLSNVLAEIEERAPILSGQRQEYDRIVEEAAHLSNQLSFAIEERDSQAKLAEDQTQKVKALNKENGLLQKQLNDLGRQVQHLLREIARRDDPTLPMDDEMEEPVAPAASVDEVITSHLVLFRNIEGLQQQNQKLLKVTRDLGEKMEHEEREYKEKMEMEQTEAIREAHEAMLELAKQMDEQKRQSDALIQSYVKERDTLKLMLSRANAGRGSTNAMVAEPANDSEIAKELEEVQSQFEAYKMEIGLDSTRLREKLIAAERETHELGAALAKANAKVEFLNDRLRIHQEDFQIRDRQLDEMSKRNQQLFDQYTRVDIECNRVTEELHVSNGRLEQLRNECANLRAEKNIWEGVQARLVEENRALSVERSHLASLMTNIQRMHGDLERSGENDRRRLEGQLQMLESQTQDLRTQLSRERDTVRHLTLQKELEAKELQTRLDKANEEVAKTREALISAETSKTHLEDRVADLTKQLQGNQEKLGVYERRPATTAAATTSVDPDLSREQQLEQEVAELRSALKVAEVDLSAARGHVQQFKDISQANEVALSSLNATFDDYKASTESQLAHRESEFKALEEKLAATTAELTQLREQHAALQKTFEEERSAWKNDKKTLEDTIVDMTTSDKHSAADRSSREEDIRIAEERVKAAEERYSNEVVAHAETFKAIEQLKKDLNAAQNKARENQSAAETAQAKLTASENSWKSQKETLDKEISDLKTRVQDLTSQNAILHQHLESVSSQASRIRATAEGSTSTTTGESNSDDADTKLSELRSVVSYLRKEKEIVDLQLELSKQEAARLKAQVDHLTSSLQETRNALTEERERAVESAASAAQHAELLERINQLNILRESNATLRAESENHAKKARQLEVKLRGLSAQLQPAQEQARTAQAELEVARGTIQRLEQECQSWQDRNRQLLSKYDRVDPVELQNLKDEVAKLKVEVEEARVAQKAAKEELAKKQTEYQDQTKTLQLAERNHARAKESIAKANINWREKLAAMSEERKAFAEEKERLNAKIAELEAHVAVAVAAAAVPQPADLTEQLQAKESQIASLQAEKEKLMADKEALSKSIAAQPTASGGEAPASWEAEKAELLKAQEETAQKLKELEEQAGKVANLKLHNEKISARMASLTKQLGEEKQKHQAALAQAKAEAASAGAGTGASSEEFAKKHSEEIENLKKQHIAEMQKLQATVSELQAAVQKAKQDAANASHAGNNSQSSAQADARVKELEAELAKVKEEQQAAIVKAMEDGRQEVALKMRVKENQLTKYTKRCKELEQRITEWESNGTLPAGSLATVGPTTTALPAQVKPAAAPGTAGAKPTPATQAKPPAAAGQAKPAAAGPSTGTAVTGALPRKPSVAGAPAAGATVAARGAAPAARGRGAARGGARGAPNRALPSRQTTPLSGGVSIMGAAAAAAASAGGAAPKRPREEGDAGAGEDSLAKRLKPAEGTAAAGSKPVQLRRPAPNT